jgi:hypothetical protein
MVFGKKKEERRAAVSEGGTLSGRQARKAAKMGGLGDDGKVRNPQGKVIADFSKRTPRER